MIYQKYDGNNVSVYIENTNDADPYTGIGAKAFLSCKNVYEIKLPDTISTIGDWAFAHMKELKKLIVPSKNISIGKDAFLDCEKLKEVVVYPDESYNQGLPYMLASCVTVLKAWNLLNFEMASEQNSLWCEMYDKELISYVNRGDNAGFQPVIVGWFNDEGEEEQLKRYVEKVKSNKINLSFLRLKYDTHLESDARETLISYLRDQISQAENGDSHVWKILREALSEDIQYVKLAVTNELISESLILQLVEYLNSNNSSTEIIAYLVSSLNGKSESIDQQFEL